MGSGEMKAGSLWFGVFIITAACAAVVSPQTYMLNEMIRSDEFSIASCNFTMNILKHLQPNSYSNLVFSPASIGMLLSILQQGAKRNTLQELNKILGLEAEESREGFSNLTLFTREPNVQMKWGNRCYLRKGMTVDSKFQKTAQNSFRLDLEEIDFETLPQEVIVSRINEWARMVTEGKIVDLVDPSMVSPNTAMLLLNAIFFKGKWLRPFYQSITSKGLFKISRTQSVVVSFMGQREKFYADKDMLLGAKWLNIPFENDRFSMVFILPTRKFQLSRLIKRLSGEDLHKIFFSRGVGNVNLIIPKFNLSGKMFLEDTLRGLGLKDIFSGASDLRGMVPENAQVSRIIHQANIEIDEAGSSSSAATVVQLQRMGTPNLHFTVDQPFLFFLVDVKEGVPLFAGKVFNPVQ